MAAISLLAALLLTVPGGRLPAQHSRLQRLVETGRHPAMRWGRFSDVQAEAERLYTKNGWAPLWTARGRPTSASRALLDVLATANDRGLEAEDYDAAQLTALAATLDRGGADAEQAIRFDAALSIGALRFVRALAVGRVPPRGTRTRFDPVPTVEQLRSTLEPVPILAALEPPWSHYHLLKRALARYRALARDSMSVRLPKPGSGGIAEGGRYPGAAKLRRLLAALGYLSIQAAAAREGDSSFSAELADGIRRFQVRQGVPVDGRLSEATWRLLTTHYARRIQQMGLALERWRWLPRELTGEPILVSLPSGRLHYALPPGFAEPNPIAMSVRVASDFPLERPVQSGELFMVMLHPAWEVGRLGRVKIPVLGDSSLYLHGSTPDAQLDSSEIGISGSLRVADAELLAELLLRDRPEWPQGRIEAALAGNKPVQVRLRRSVPLLVVYGTAVARENGQVFFSQDRLGEDQRLQRVLARGYPYEPGN